MADTQPNQAMKTDGAGDDPVANAGGKDWAGGGESGGGAYPNPQTGKDGDESGFMGHGGQSHIDYSGPGDKDTDDAVGNENAVTKA